MAAGIYKIVGRTVLLATACLAQGCFSYSSGLRNAPSLKDGQAKGTTRYLLREAIWREGDISKENKGIAAITERIIKSAGQEEAIGSDSAPISVHVRIQDKLTNALVLDEVAGTPYMLLALGFDRWDFYMRSDILFLEEDGSGGTFIQCWDDATMLVGVPFIPLMPFGSPWYVNAKRVRMLITKSFYLFQETAAPEDHRCRRLPVEDGRKEFSLESE